jgi:RNA polymerase sigma factor (sigma-70 family)
MDSGQAGTILRQLRMLAGVPTGPPTSDRQLLERFAGQHDDVAFAALVERHGPMVLRVCRRVLHDRATADDAFQATFLVLLRKARTVGRRGSLAGWLYGVVVRIALHLKADAARRQRLESRASRRCPEDPAVQAARGELCAVVDEELSRLPERYRLPLFLCYLDGQTRDEAARQLGWSLGTPKRRLEQGRELLRARLGRRGWTLPAALTGAALSQQPGAGAVPTDLADGVVRSARPFLTGQPGGTVSARATAAAQVLLRGVFTQRLRVPVLLLLLLGAVAGAGLLAHRAGPGAPAAANDEEQPPPAGTNDRPEAGTERSLRSDRYGDPLPPGALVRLGTVRFRPGSQVCAVAFSPDGRSLLSSGEDHKLCIWDIPTGKMLRQLAVPEGMLTCAFYSPDGKSIVSAGWDYPSGGDTTIRIWGSTIGRQTRKFTATGNPFRSGNLAMSPNGKTLAFSGMSNVVYLGDIATGATRELRCADKDDYTSSVAFAAGGQLLASGGGKAIRLWDLETGKMLREFMSQGAVQFLTCSPDGKILAAAERKALRLLDARTGEELRRLDESPAWIKSLAFTPDGKMLASAGAGGQVVLWDIETGAAVRRLSRKEGLAQAVAFSPDGKTLAVGYLGATIQLWDIVTGKNISPFEGHENDPVFVAFMGDGKQLVSGAWDGTVRVWETATGAEVRRLSTPGTSAFSQSLSPDGRTLAAATDRGIQVYDLSTGKEAGQFQGRPHATLAIAYAPDGKMLASAGRSDGFIRLWDLATGKGLPPPGTRHTNGPLSLAFAPNGSILASGGEYDHTICLWDLATRKELRRWPAHGSVKTPGPHGIIALAFAPDGKTLASIGLDNTVCIWETATGKQRSTLSGGGPRAFYGGGPLAFSPDGKTLATSPGDGTVRLWEVLTGAERSRFAGHRGWVLKLAFSPNGKQLASASNDTTVLIWDVRAAASVERPLNGRFSPNEGDALWDRLAGADAAAAYRAMCALEDAPGVAVPVVRERLQPAPVPDSGAIARLVKDLDSDQFSVRQKAVQELERLEEAARPGLREALAGRPSPEVHRQVEELLDRLSGPVPPPGQLRQLRAVEVLEQIGTGEARDVLRGLAEGDRDAPTTQDAKAALDRLARRPAP